MPSQDDTQAEPPTNTGYRNALPTMYAAAAMTATNNNNNSSTTAPGARNNRPPSAAAAIMPGISTRLVPGEPHLHDMSIRRFLGRHVHYIICRCHTPALHRDAVTFILPFFALDHRFRPISWKETMRRILHLHDRVSMTRRQQLASYHDVLEFWCAEWHLRQEDCIDLAVSLGANVGLNPSSVHHAGDGHQRLFLDERGLRTRVQRPAGAGLGWWGPGYHHHRRRLGDYGD